MMTTSTQATPETSIGRRWRDLALVTAFLLVLVVPAIAFVIGVRPANEENRALAPAPKLTLASVGDPAYFSALDRHLADQFPFKNGLVWADAAFRYFVLRASPNSDVVPGADGWLFSRDAMAPDCRFTADQVLDQLDRVAAALASADVAFSMVVVPDKQAIHSEHRPPGFHPCTDRERPAMISGMAKREETAIELWTVLEQLHRSDSALLYWPHDTHWTPIGAMAGFRAVVMAMAPDAWNDQIVVRRGTMERVGDLSRLMGLPTTDSEPAISIEPRRRLERAPFPLSFPVPPGREVQRVVVAGEPSTVPGRTLIVHDSAFAVYGDLLASWFTDTVWLHVNVLVDHPEIVADLPPFDRVIVERVERFAYGRDYEAMLAPIIERVTGAGAPR